MSDRFKKDVDALVTAYVEDDMPRARRIMASVSAEIARSSKGAGGEFLEAMEAFIDEAVCRVLVATAIGDVLRKHVIGLVVGHVIEHKRHGAADGRNPPVDRMGNGD